MKSKNIYLAIVLLAFLATPFVTRAADASCLWSGGCWGPLLSCTGDYIGKNPTAPGGPTTPCTSFCDILVTAQNILYFALSLLIYGLTPAFITWGGILILTSGGSPGRLESGKKIVTGTVIGLLIALGAFIIVNTFLWALGNPTGKWSRVECTPSAPPSSSEVPVGG